MTTDGATELILGAMLVWMTTAGPMLFCALVVGVAVGILQAATQINEASVGFLTKLVAMGVVLATLGSWSMQHLVDYTQRTFASIADVTR